MIHDKPRLDLEDLAAEAMRREDYSPDKLTILVVSDALEEAGQ